jgi:predicted S18 family serine protease
MTRRAIVALALVAVLIVAGSVTALGRTRQSTASATIGMSGDQNTGF